MNEEDLGNLEGTSLLAVTKLSSLLGNKELKLPESLILRASRLPFTIEKIINEYLSTEEFLPIKLNLHQVDIINLPDILTNTLNNMQKKVQSLEEYNDVSSGIDTMINYSLSISKAINYLQSAIPKLPVSISNRKQRLSDFESSRFNRIYRTIDDPMSVLHDMSMGCLSREQVDTLANVYPELYELMKEVMFAAAAKKVAKNSEYQIPYEKLKQISVLMLSSTVPPDLQSILQSSFQSEKAQEMRGSGKDSIDTAKRMAPEISRVTFGK